MSVNQSEAKDIGYRVGMQREKLPIYDSYQGTGDHTEVFPINMREILICNDSLTADLTIQIIGPASLNTTFTLKPYEIMDERLTEFSSVVIDAVGAWRFWTRTHLLP